MTERKRIEARTPSGPRSKAKYADDPSEPNRCHAANKRNGERCRRSVVRGQLVCRLHGGASTGRPTTVGKFSKVLTRMRESYEDALSDRDALYSLDETLSLMQVLTERALQRAEECDSPNLRSNAFGLLKDALASMDSGDGKRAGVLFRELYDLLEVGVAEDSTTDALTKAVEKFAARKERAWDVRLKAADVMNKKDMTILIGRFIDSVVKHGSAEVARKVARDISMEMFHDDDPEAWHRARPAS
jgi:hypothetical protein